ncbi:hypothetical protein BCR36DRAFT_413759 [Piromyces finnis]|uniref:Uncharacterized protein n=1 Tax=Piromyces finnis TaxID=1754191 RepID=A0A1Y1V6D8_9FUNG|nr:hypothetical protein BCR36DRAFT_413759 [Piromyces finnis]|eukprot:ORX47104.1 hypothetical protein BCR36DRAFT_413759 [Piromyces finnis]
MEIKKIVRDTKKRKNETLEYSDHKEKLIHNTKRKKRGPKIGFIQNKVNDELKKILEQSDIPCEIENGEVVIKNVFNSDSLIKNKEKMNENGNFSANANSNINKRNIIPGSFDEFIENLNTLYRDYLNPSENENEEMLNNSHFVFSLDEFKNKNNPTTYRELYLKEYTPKDSFQEFKFDNTTETLYIDFNLISDFFKYAFSISLAINPGVLLMKIKQKTLLPGLLFAIYATAYLYRPNCDKEKYNFYLSRSKYYLFKTLHKENIQNLQTAHIIANIEPGTYSSYILSGFMVRLLKMFKNTKDINAKEYIDFYYGYINSELLLNLTCNCLPENFSWLDEAIPKVLLDHLILFGNHPLERLQIKTISVTRFLVKVLNHIRCRRKGEFDKNEFKKLIDESDDMLGILIEDYNFIQSNKFKNSLTHQYYIHALFTIAKMLLYNIELSPYVYKKKISFSNKYINIKTRNTTNHNYDENDSRSSSHNNMNDEEDDGDDDDDSQLEFDYKNRDFREKYDKYCILKNIKFSGFNYKLYDKEEEEKEEESKRLDKDSDPLEFLELHPLIKDFDYKKYYHLCFENAEWSKLILRRVNERLQNYPNRAHYPCYLGFIFYHLGLFYMMIYANLKLEQFKEDIEYFHEQIKVMNEPYISFYYDKLYENAKKEAYDAFLEDSLIFCPRGLI